MDCSEAWPELEFGAMGNQPNTTNEARRGHSKERRICGQSARVREPQQQQQLVVGVVMGTAYTFKLA